MLAAIAAAMSQFEFIGDMILPHGKEPESGTGFDACDVKEIFSHQECVGSRNRLIVK